LTRRQCASKVAELFDLTGKVSPLIASMKIDLQDLVQRQLNWDDIIPDNLRSIWESNFDMMKEIGDLRFNRAIVPEDAIDLKMDTLDFGDASHSMVCVSIYGRFLRRNGEYSFFIESHLFSFVLLFHSVPCDTSVSQFSCGVSFVLKFIFVNNVSL
uniref:Uncharacterized protein n=1 Tax=Clytia hemisphaerica TaxID=252671 RepID=A0A7M5USX5_9CNID